VLASYLRTHGRLNDNTVVATVMSNIGLEIALRVRRNQTRPHRRRRQVRSGRTLRLNASLGGEQSGHIILPELSLAGDGMITALSLIRALRDSGKSLAQMTAGFNATRKFS
jgi:phosphoglucosamine mutase